MSGIKVNKVKVGKRDHPVLKEEWAFRVPSVRWKIKTIRFYKVLIRFMNEFKYDPSFVLQARLEQRASVEKLELVV